MKSRKDSFYALFLEIFFQKYWESAFKTGFLKKEMVSASHTGRVLII